MIITIIYATKILYIWKDCFMMCARNVSFFKQLKPEPYNNSVTALFNYWQGCQTIKSNFM